MHSFVHSFIHSFIELDRGKGAYCATNRPLIGLTLARKLLIVQPMPIGLRKTLKGLMQPPNLMDLFGTAIPLDVVLKHFCIWTIQ